MPTKTDNNQQSAIDRGYKDGFDGGNNAYTSAGIDQLEAMANDPAQHNDESVKDAEENPGQNNPNQPGWKTSIQHGKGMADGMASGMSKNKLKAIFRLTRKKGIIGGALALFGIGTGLLMGVFGPATMLHNLMENFTLTNDSSSTVMERRFMKVFGKMVDPDNDTICANSTKNIKCRRGRISNKAIASLNKKGIVAYATPDGSVQYAGGKSGYPEKNPVGYGFEDGVDANGAKKYRYVAANDLANFVLQPENRKMLGQIYGIRGAFNMRLKAHTGKMIANKFYKPFGLERKGGVADGENRKATTKERIQSVKERMKTKIPGAEKISTVATSIQEKARGQLTKAGRAGALYTTAVAGCIVSKAPSYIATGVAAVMIAQAMPFIMEYVLSPSGKQKAAAVGADFTSEDMDATASTLTEQTPRPSDGKKTSALDSVFALTAMGVNKHKLNVNNYASVIPGLSVLNNSAFRTSQDVAESAAPACSHILSPPAMYTAMAVDTAATVAASATVIGGIIKVVASFAIVAVATEVAVAILGEGAKAALNDLASSDAFENAEGEQLGDILGVSAMAFFASSALSRGIPVLKRSQLLAFNEIKQESLAMERSIAIATHSPFDITNSHTFLGSIVHNMGTAMIANRTFTSVPSALGSLMRLPSLVTTATTAGATNGYDETYCGYAEEFNQTTENPNDTPGITASGLPCPGFTKQQIDMDPSLAVDLMVEEGWVNEELTTPETATIDEMMGTDIPADTLLYDYWEECSNPSSGDYIINAAGCSIPSTPGETNQSGQGRGACDTVEDQEVCLDGFDGVESGEDITAPKHPLSPEAMAVFLIDDQIAKAINGEDDETGDGTQGAGAGIDGDYVSPSGLPDGSDTIFYTYNPFGIVRSSGRTHDGIDLFGPSDIRAIAAGDVLYAGWCDPGSCGGFGNYVHIRHDNGLESLYAHLTNGGVHVTTGQRVEMGQHIGEMGTTGNSRGVHLHIELTDNGTLIDPLEFFKSHNINFIHRD